jgi:A/G-specific adenine glycosylase
VKCAKVVAERGGFPEAEEELRKLPGLGAYTAAAIAAIAFGVRAVVVDANVERVVARLFAIEEPLPGARKAIRARAEEITPELRAGDFAQGLMDLGSQICTTRAPRCLLCPLAEDCAGRKTGDPEALPVKPPKKAKPQRVGTAYWIEDRSAEIGAHVWLTRREGQGMLGGMRALPDDGWSAKRDGHGEPPLSGEWRDAGALRHSFTHFDLSLQLMVYVEGPLGSLGAGEWWPIDELDEAGLPTLFAKASRLALA